MDHITLYLEKFKSLAPSRDRVKQAVVDAVYEVLGVDILLGEIIIRENEISIRTHATLRSEIFIKRAQITEKLEQALQGTLPGVRICKI